MNVTIVTTEGDNTLLAGLRAALEGADSALLCVARVQSAGVHLLHRQLADLGDSARLLATTVLSEGTAALATAHGFGASVAVLNPGSGTYHPKVYLARRGSEAVAIVGSVDLAGGLVNNVEAAVMMQGTVRDEPLKAAWDFGEALWTSARAAPWSPGGKPVSEEAFSPALHALLAAAIEANKAGFATLDQGRLNKVTAITPTGLSVETEVSKAKGHRPQLIPAWMLTLAWDSLHTHGRLTSRYLSAADGLDVKKASAVCAILAKLPGVSARARTADGVVLTVRG